MEGKGKKNTKNTRGAKRSRHEATEGESRKEAWNNKTTNWWRRFVIVHVEVICQRGERQQDRSSYCKPIRANTSQKSSFVVVSGLHKSFIMMHLRSAFLKKKKRKEIKDEGDKKEEDKKKKKSHTLNKHTISAYDSHQLFSWEAEWESKSSSKEIQICLLHNYKFILS